MFVTLCPAESVSLRAASSSRVASAENASLATAWSSLVTAGREGERSEILWRSRVKMRPLPGTAVESEGSRATRVVRVASCFNPASLTALEPAVSRPWRTVAKSSCLGRG